MEPCEFGSGEGFYDAIDEMHFGVMLHGMNYPDETGANELATRLWQPVMKFGVVEFIRPEACTLIRPIKQMEPKSFVLKQSMQ